MSCRLFVQRARPLDLGLSLCGCALGLRASGGQPRLLGRDLISQRAFPRDFSLSLCGGGVSFCGGAFRFSSGTPLRFKSLLCFSLSSEACVFFGLSFRAGGLPFGFRFATGRRLTL